MAVIYHDYDCGGKGWCTLRRTGIPVTFHSNIRFSENENTVKFLTMRSCKGLEFPLVAIPGIGRLETGEQRKEEDAHLRYVDMTRATRELLLAGAQARSVCPLFG
jgi:superfamily I DNA/RNA helicase